MIIRRFVRAIRQQDWGVATIDFVIVVLGIFVGLQVDDWNKARAAADVERETLALIVSDIRREADAFDWFIERYTDALDGARDVAALIQSHPNVNPGELAAAAKLSLTAWIWVPYDAVYRNLQQSGDFSVIGNEEIAFRLVEHYQSWGGAFDIIAREVDESRDDYRRALYTTMIQYPVFEEDGSVSFSLPSIDDIGALRDDGVFWASLHMHITNIELGIRHASIRRDRAREEIRLIEDYLELPR